MTNLSPIPEDKLLHIIRKGKEASGKMRMQNASFLRALQRITWVNALRGVALILSGVFLLLVLWRTFFSEPYTERIENLKEKSLVNLNISPEGQTIKMPDFKDYGSTFSSKNLFTAAQTVKPVKKSERHDPNLKYFESLTLSGIVEGASKQAIVNDGKGKTYFLKMHGRIGAFQVTDIQKGTVSLAYDGTSYELNI